MDTLATISIAVFWFLGVPMALAGIALPFVQTGFQDTASMVWVVWTIGNAAWALKIVANAE